MLVVLAPNAFASTLTAAEAADAMALGWRGVRPGDDVRIAPMADGGDGTLDVVAVAVRGATRHTTEVADARGHATSADWLLLPDGRALIESAQACGLHRLAPDQRSPRLATTYGVGQLIAAAAASGVKQIVVGLGGSATVDGGAGMATALGHRLLRDDGNGVKVGAEYLTALDRIEPRPPLGIPVVAAYDVTAPLLGPAGAVAGFAAQKGADAEDCAVLDVALETLAEVAERDLDGGPWRDLPGAGAAGGLGFGLAAFAGAELRSGAELIANLIHLEPVIANADIVITGEGRVDGWSQRAKATGYVADLARKRNVRVAAITGSVVDGAGSAFDEVLTLGEQGLANPREAVAAAAAALAKLLSG